MQSKATKIIMCILIIVGLSMMAYPVISSFLNQMHSSKVIDGYKKNVKNMSEVKKQEMLKAAHAYNAKLSQSKIVMSDPFDEEAIRSTTKMYKETLSVDDSGLMAFLDIPCINVHLPIYHGVSEKVLAHAVGHLEGTSLPVGGKGTHTVLSAHTALAQARLFTDLDEMKKGDLFQIHVLDTTLTYKVYSIEVITPDQISSLVISPGKDLCTLVTCTPYGINTHRLLVHGKRVANPKHVLKVKDRKNWVVWLIVVIFLILVMFTIYHKRKKHKKVEKLRRELLTHG